MATPPSIRQITRESLGEVPSWFERVLTPLNAFLQQVTDSQSNNLTPAQNFAMRWVDLPVVEGTNVYAPLVANLGGRPVKGISVEQVQYPSSLGVAPPAPSTAAGVAIAWQRVSVPTEGGGTSPGFQVVGVSGLPTGARAVLTLLVKAE